MPALRRSRFVRHLVICIAAMFIPVREQTLRASSLARCNFQTPREQQRPLSPSDGSVVERTPAGAGGGGLAGKYLFARQQRHYWSRGSTLLLAAGEVTEDHDGDVEISNDGSLQHDLLQQEQQQDGRHNPTQRLPKNSRRTAELASRKRWQRIRPMAVAEALGSVFQGRRSRLNSGATLGQNRAAADDGGGRGVLHRFRARQRQGWRKNSDSAGGRPAPAGRAGSVGGERSSEQEKELGKTQANGDDPTAADTAVSALTTAAAMASMASTGDGGDIANVVVGGGVASRPATYDGEEVSPEAWVKVDELRARAEKSNPNAGEEEKGLLRWLATGGGEGRQGLTDTDLLRFIMFRHGDVEAAWQQLKRAAAWRQERRVEAVLSEQEWSRHKELQAEIFWVGRDKEGRPTMVLRSIAHHPGAIDTEKFQRYFLFLLEQGRQLWGLGGERQLNIIVDRVGAGIKNQDPRLLKTMLPVFRDAYPDIVYRCYVAPTSWIFRFVWIIAARLVDDRQRKRVVLLSPNWQSRLLEDFDASILPPHLGGKMVDYPPRQPPDMREGLRASNSSPSTRGILQ